VNEADNTFARPRVSVLMPCRNAAPHLGAAIASIEAQTFRDYEVVAVDDGSRDESASLLEAWGSRDARVRVFRTKPQGIVAALQLASSWACAPLLARMDADDIAHPDRLARQVQLLDAHSRVVACGTQVRYVPRAMVRDGARRYERWLNGLIEPAQLERDLFVECPIAHPTLIVRSDAFHAVGGYCDRAWPEDYDLILRLWQAGGALANTPAVLLDWRESEARLSRTDPRYAEDTFRRCKIHYLRERLESGKGVVVWGAGPVGKGFARLLREAGIVLRAFVDLDPRKIGQTIHGAPVIAPAGLDAFRGAFALAAVAGAGPRSEIRAALDSAGWREMVEYCAVA
jgi:glycosyltransferase involved in cell wall biosynthesis